LRCGRPLYRKQSDRCRRKAGGRAFDTITLAPR